MDEGRRLLVAGGSLVLARRFAQNLLGPFNFLAAEPAVQEPSPAQGKTEVPTLDEATNEMFSTLSKVKRESLADPRYRFNDNGSFSVSTDLAGYDLFYHVSDDGQENVQLRKDNGRWDFILPMSCDLRDIGLDYYHGTDRTDRVLTQYRNSNAFPSLVPTFSRIRDLFDIEIHKQDSRGRDLSKVVEEMFQRCISIDKFEIEYEDDFDVNARFSRDGLVVEASFTVSPRLGRKANYFEISIKDGEREVALAGEYSEAGEGFLRNMVVTDVGESTFSQTPEGKLDFPKKAYGETSAMAFFARGGEIASLLTKVITQQKLPNYTQAFLDIVSSAAKNVGIESESDDHYRIQVGETSIDYDGSYSHLAFIKCTSGDNKVRIIVDRNTGLAEKVEINEHPFILKDGKVRFIASTYSLEEATSVINGAQDLYRRIKNVSQPDLFKK
mgnify:CR=1 FL=1